MFFKSDHRVVQPWMAQKPQTDYRWELYLLRRKITLSYRPGGKGTMGRFGGGWEIKFGFQSGSLKGLLLLNSLIVDLFVISIRFGVQTEKDNEVTARSSIK